MKLPILPELGDALVVCEVKMLSADRTLQVALDDHRKCMEAIDNEAETVWKTIAEQYQLSYEDATFQHIHKDGLHYVITQAEQGEIDG